WHAGGHHVTAPGERPSSSAASSRIRHFWILPVTVIGNESTIFQWRGTLNEPLSPRQAAASCSSSIDAPSRSLTHAATSSPYRSLGTPNTAASLTSGRR